MFQSRATRAIIKIVSLFTAFLFSFIQTGSANFNWVIFSQNLAVNFSFRHNISLEESVKQLNRHQNAEVTAASSQGGRSEQQDRHVNVRLELKGVKHGQGRLMAVADGAGQTMTAEHLSGRLAFLFEEAMMKHDGNISLALRASIAILHEETRGHFRSVSTLSVVYIPDDEPKAYAAVLGDSPVIILDPEGVRTGPTHNVKWNEAERREAVTRGGEYSEERRGNLVAGYIGRQGYSRLQYSRALGLAEFEGILNREPEITVFDLNPASTVLLSSDGLFNDSDPQKIKSQASAHLWGLIGEGSKAQELANEAVIRRTNDNVTVLLWQQGKSNIALPERTEFQPQPEYLKTQWVFGGGDIKLIDELIEIQRQAWALNVDLQIKREISERTVKFAHVLLKAVQETPVALLQKAPKPIMLDVVKIFNKHLKGYDHAGSLAGMAVGVTQAEIFPGAGVFDELDVKRTVAHELVHELSTTQMKERNDLLFPIEDWLELLESQEYTVLKVKKTGSIKGEEHEKQLVNAYLDVDRHGPEEVIKRIRTLSGEMFTDQTSEEAVYRASPHEILAWNATGESAGFGKDRGKVMQLLERHLLRSTDGKTVYSFNTRRGMWESRVVEPFILPEVERPVFEPVTLTLPEQVRALKRRLDDAHERTVIRAVVNGFFPTADSYSFSAPSEHDFQQLIEKVKSEGRDPLLQRMKPKVPFGRSRQSYLDALSHVIRAVELVLKNGDAWDQMEVLAHRPDVHPVRLLRVTLRLLVDWANGQRNPQDPSFILERYSERYQRLLRVQRKLDLELEPLEQLKGNLLEEAFQALLQQWNQGNTKKDRALRLLLRTVLTGTGASHIHWPLDPSEFTAAGIENVKRLSGGLSRIPEAYSTLPETAGRQFITVGFLTERFDFLLKGVFDIHPNDRYKKNKIRERIPFGALSLLLQGKKQQAIQIQAAEPVTSAKVVTFYLSA